MKAPRPPPPPLWTPQEFKEMKAGEKAVDALPYVRQNPWTFFDPLGLRAETKEETEIFDKLDEHRADIDAGSVRIQKDLDKARKDGSETEGLALKLERNMGSARGIHEMTEDLRNQIDGVAEGGEDPIGLRVSMEALRIWADPEKGKAYDPGVAGGATCNQFVNDVLENAGLIPPKRFGMRGVGPKGTTEWHMMVVFAVGDQEQGGTGKMGPTFIRNGQTGKHTQSRNPEAGGVISYPGHVAIYGGHGMTIGSTQSMPTTGSKAKNPISIIRKADTQNQIIFGIDVPNR